MNRAKSMLYGATALLFAAAGSATAETFADAQREGAMNPSAIYSVDEDRDGRAERELILEQSDSLA